MGSLGCLGPVWMLRPWLPQQGWRAPCDGGAHSIGRMRTVRWRGQRFPRSFSPHRKSPQGSWGCYLSSVGRSVKMLMSSSLGNSLASVQSTEKSFRCFEVVQSLRLSWMNLRIFGTWRRHRRECSCHWTAATCPGATETAAQVLGMRGRIRAWDERAQGQGNPATGYLHPSARRQGLERLCPE